MNRIQSLKTCLLVGFFFVFSNAWAEFSDHDVPNCFFVLSNSTYEPVTVNLNFDDGHQFHEVLASRQVDKKLAYFKGQIRSSTFDVGGQSIPCVRDTLNEGICMMHMLRYHVELRNENPFDFEPSTKYVCSYVDCEAYFDGSSTSGPY